MLFSVFNIGLKIRIIKNKMSVWILFKKLCLWNKVTPSECQDFWGILIVLILMMRRPIKNFNKF